MEEIISKASQTWQIQVIFWALLSMLGLLFGLCAWFIQRFVSHQDANFEDVSRKLVSLEDMIRQVSTDWRNYAAEIALEAMELRKTAVEFRIQTEMSLQSLHDVVGGLVERLHGVSESGSQISVALFKIQHRADAFAEKLDEYRQTLKSLDEAFKEQIKEVRSFNSELEGLRATVAKAASLQKAVVSKLSSHDEAIKTVKIEMDKYTMISSNKKKEE